MTHKELSQAIFGLASYLYNTSNEGIVKGIFPNAEEGYIEEKTHLLEHRGIASFLGRLDLHNFDKFVTNVEVYMKNTGV